MTLDVSDAEALDRCIADGGVAVFPADTVYGLACDPQSTRAVGRLYALKGRPSAKPAAVLFFALGAALDALPGLGQRTREALERLLPGALTVLLPNPERRFSLACGADPQTLGLRVPALTASVQALATIGRPLLQSSANRAGGLEARAVHEVDVRLRAEVDLVLDGGVLPGTPSTVVDLRAYEAGREWSVLREGALSRSALASVLGE
ncbi:MAG: L-threonylcarbamoyladenylate synthase [Actinomycetota bacterium]|nr:L-threonylcarbamoyladenylate synthase [Actinomycetota bacterium]